MNKSAYVTILNYVTHLIVYLGVIVGMNHTQWMVMGSVFGSLPVPMEDLVAISDPWQA